MKGQLLALSRRYRAALQKHLQEGPKSRVGPAHRLGQQAVTLGLERLDLDGIHKTALTALVPPGSSAAARDRMFKRAGIFFTEAITPIQKTHRAGMKSFSGSNQEKETATQRTTELAAASHQLKQGIIHRKAAEKALRKSAKHQAKLLRDSHHLQKHLRHLTHRLLSTQEAERKKMSHKLHDGIAQTLLGINVRLLTLKKAAGGSTANLTKEIASTQRVVEKSVQLINRFAHELDIHKRA